VLLERDPLPAGYQLGRQLGRFRAIAGRRWELEQPHQIQRKHACRDLTRLDGPVEHKRLMGFEPTTFCMASRRSSQLSYSRASGKV
jgi:hypothetical protein